MVVYIQDLELSSSDRLSPLRRRATLFEIVGAGRSPAKIGRMLHAPYNTDDPEPQAPV